MTQPSISDNNSDCPKVLDRPLRVTLFGDHTATWRLEKAISPRGLANAVKTVNATTKPSLPWLKLAKFGDVPTSSGSLRHNSNVLTVTGIEADYDGGAIPLDAAVDLVRKAGLAAVLYTSPSHTSEKPRWRVLCPFSRELEPSVRGKMVSRLNGVLGGCLAGESWTLSQAFYFGFVAGNEKSHEVELVDGDAIDVRDDLDAGAIRKPVSKSNATGQGQTGNVHELNAERAKRILTGAQYHDCLRDLAASFVGSGMPSHNVAAYLKQLMHLSTGPRDDRWEARFASIDGLVESARQRFGDAAERRAHLIRTGRWLRSEGKSREEIKLGVAQEAKRTGVDLAEAVIALEEVFAPEDYFDGEPAPEPEPEPEPEPQQFVEACDPWNPLEAPDFPIETLPPVLGDFVKDRAAVLGVHQAPLAWTCLSACSAAIDGRSRLRMKRHDQWTVPPGLWVALFGPVSSKKTPMQNTAWGPLQRLQSGPVAQYLAAKKEWDQQGKRAGLPEPVWAQRYVAKDATIEALGEILSRQSRGIGYLRDELSGWIGQMERYGGSRGDDR